MVYQNVVELFRELSRAWKCQEPSSIDLVQVRMLDGSLRWVTSFGLHRGNFVFTTSSDQPEHTVCVPEVLRYIASHMKGSIRAGGDHPSDEIFEAQVTSTDGTTELPLKNFMIDGRIVVLEP